MLALDRDMCASDTKLYFGLHERYCSTGLSVPHPVQVGHCVVQYSISFCGEGNFSTRTTSTWAAKDGTKCHLLFLRKCNEFHRTQFCVCIAKH